MIKVLVSIDADLPSSIALRYTCQMAKDNSIEIQTIHVQEPDAAGPGGIGMGTGWARRAYEKDLVDQSKKGISQLLTAESGFCPVLNEPIIVSGDHDKEILEELQKGVYDLFVEGMPVLSSSKNLSKHLKSNLYHHSPVPVLLVQNLYPLRRVLFAVESEKETATLLGAFANLFGGKTMEFNLALLTRDPQQKLQEGLLAEAAGNYGWQAGKLLQLPGSANSWDESIQNFDLTAILIDQHRGQSSLQLEFMGKLSCPILFFWK